MIDDVQFIRLIPSVSNVSLQPLLDVVSGFHLTDVLHSHHSAAYSMAALLSFARLERASLLASRAVPCMDLFLGGTAASLERDTICPLVVTALCICGCSIS